RARSAHPNRPHPRQERARPLVRLTAPQPGVRPSLRGRRLRLPCTHRRLHCRDAADSVLQAEALSPARAVYVALEPFAAVRCRPVERRADRHDAGWIDTLVAPIVMVLDVIEVNSGGDPRSLE